METVKLPLTQGQFALIDASDYQWASQFRWRAFGNSARGTYRAIRADQSQGKTVTVQLSREILGLKRGDKRQADHINRDTLDNRRSNLRIATHAENQRNQKTSRRSRSGLKGATFNKNRGLWMAAIVVDKRQIFLGYHSTAQEAHDAYCAAAKEHFGDFARFA